nr:probable E3 ubiquitin-protein ligase XERICO [Onthophagus taurus]
MPYPAVAVVVAAGVIIGGILYYLNQSSQAQTYNYDRSPPRFRAPSPRRNSNNRTSSNNARNRRRSQQEPTTVCVICFDKFEEDSQSVITLNCQHKYHYFCLQEWFEKSSRICPICRETIRN